ncbi:MAG TPA: efflux transporter outer membrane subunit [Caulobacteraceae bacterium]|nr:efflux transporter outer membrane subunit [Caulobacteraceae bacterium]
MTRRAILAAALLALAGCKVGPSFAPPAAPGVSGYLMAGDQPSAVAVLDPTARPAGPWWKTFRSPALDSVMERALADNDTLAAADATLERTRQQAAAVRGAELPQADLSASAQRERINIAAFGFKGFPNPTINLYAIGPTVSYDLDLFGGRKRATEAALAQAQGEARRADAAYLTLTGQVTLAALQIATLRGEIATQSEVAADDQRLIDLVQRAVAGGGQPRAALASPRAQLAQDQAVLPPLEQQLSRARHGLALLVGQAPASWTAPQFDLASFHAPAAVPVSLPSSLVRRRPDILAAEADLHAATARIGVASAALYPDVRLSANFIQSALSPTSLFTYGSTGWDLAAGLTQPLFHGGTLRANKRAAVADARASLAQYRQTVLTAFVQVADVMEAIAHDDDELAALAHAEDAATANLNSAELSFRLGGGALLPVLDAQRLLSQARRSRAIAQGQRLADIAQLYVATAADWREAGR